METLNAMKSISKDYMNLIRRFPLMPINSKGNLKEATTLIDELSDRLDTLSSAERAYFDVLCSLVQHYESKIYKPLDRITPSEALKYLMEINSLTLTDLIPVVHHKSHLSAFLNGKRGLSKINAMRLAERFKVSPALFLPSES